MKRCGIFYFNCKMGEEGYLFYLLNSMEKFLGKIYIIANKTNYFDISKCNIEAECIYVEEQIENNIEAYFVGLNKLYILKQISLYDEVVMFDSSFFGPLFDLKPIFTQMEKSKVDYWTISFQYDSELNMFYHSYFIVFNKNMLVNECLMKIFLDTNKVEDDEQLTNLFKENGFIGSSYIENTITDASKIANTNICIKNAYLLLSKYNIPIVPIAVFEQNDDFNIEGKRVFEFIKNKTGYNCNFIWDYLLNNYNVEKIKKNLALNYILSTQFCRKENKKINKKIAMIAHLYYPDLLSESIEYLKMVPKEIDLFITTGNRVTYKMLMQQITEFESNNIKEIRLVENKGRDVAALLVSCKDITCSDYEILCFIHDKKSSGENIFSVGENFRYVMWENIVGSENYIRNIIDQFENEPRLGLLVPPIPKHKGFEKIYGTEWGVKENIQNSVHLLNKLAVHVPSFVDSSPIALSTSFWCRVSSLNKLFTYPFTLYDFDADPFPGDGFISHAIERCLPYIVQDAGYFTSVVETSEYASIELVNLYDKMKKYVPFEDEKNHLLSSIYPFITRFDKLYVYGCGKIASVVTKVMRQLNQEFEGYIVSDKNHIGEYEEKKVWWIEEIKPEDNIGIIVALGLDNKKEAQKYLDENGYNCYYWRQ